MRKEYVPKDCMRLTFINYRLFLLDDIQLIYTKKKKKHSLQNSTLLNTNTLYSR